MAQLLTMSANTLQAPVTVTTTNETLVLVSPPVSNPTAGGAMVIIATMVATIGTGGSSITLRVHRDGTLQGAVIDRSWVYAVSAGSTANFSIMAIDYPGDRDHMVYGVSVQVAGATGNSTISYAGIVVLTI